MWDIEIYLDKGGRIWVGPFCFPTAASFRVFLEVCYEFEWRYLPKETAIPSAFAKAEGEINWDESIQRPGAGEGS